MTKEIEAHPQLIVLDPFEVKQAIDEIQKNINKSTEVEVHDDTHQLRHLTLPSHSYYFELSDNKDIDYLVRYKKVQLPGMNFAIRQVLVHRTRNGNIYLAGLAKRIFWDYLLPKAKLISDSQQTDKGKEFWEYAISVAISKKVPVHLIDTNTNSYTLIESNKDFMEKAKNAWGSSKFFQRYIFMIG